MAGGDPALLLSDEMPEDDPQLGAAEAEKVFEVNECHSLSLALSFTVYN